MSEPVSSAMIMRTLRTPDQINGAIVMYVLASMLPPAEIINGLETIKAEVEKQLVALATGDVPQ